MSALTEAGVQPERFFPEYAPHQFEIPVEPADGLASADRGVVLREVVREIARRDGMRASFAPLLDPAIRRAAELMHSQPAHQWTITELAKEASM